MFGKVGWLQRLVLCATVFSVLAISGSTNGQNANELPALTPASPAGVVTAWAEGKEPAPPPVTDLLAQPEEETPPPIDQSSLLASRTRIVRLAGMPNMFGDSFEPGVQMLGLKSPGAPSPLWTPYPFGDRTYFFLADLPPLGGARRAKVAENNKALPMDRVFFNYNHFHNAFESIVPPAGPFSVDRYTTGVEKTFCCGQHSIEVRLPLVGEFNYHEPGLDIHNGVLGNLEIGFKRLLFATQSTAAAAGMYIDAPIGSNLVARTPTDEVILHNDAVHLLPYVGYLSAPGDLFFFQGFLQLDIATNSNRVDFNSVGVGSYTEQNLLFLDSSVGCWLYRNPYARRFRGLALVVEHHFTTTLQDADVVGTNIFGNFIELRNINNRMDISNITVGLHAEIGETMVRVGGVLPIEDEDDRLFDGEVQVSINRYF